MYYKIIFTILIGLTVILTASIGVIKPRMHKSVFIYDSQFKITSTKEVKIEQKSIPIMEQPASSPQTKRTEVQNTETKSQKIISTSQDTKVQNVKITTQTAPTKQNIKITTQKQQNTIKQEPPQIDLNKIVNNNKIIQTKTTTPNNAPAPIKQTATQTVQQTTKISSPISTSQPQIKTVQAPEPVKVLSQQEEIAWNIWRSNLTNKIMQDTNFPAVPPGTVFRYKFEVDKYGKITNIQTWSDNSKYTPYAIQYMAPVIRNLQGRSILIFPSGTKRSSVNAWGAWKISNRTIYSAPSDYNDIERIKK